jgi:hypothetical protein
LREKTKKDNRDIEKDTFSSSFDSSRLKWTWRNVKAIVHNECVCVSSLPKCLYNCLLLLWSLFPLLEFLFWMPFEHLSCCSPFLLLPCVLQVINIFKDSKCAQFEWMKWQPPVDLRRNFPHRVAFQANTSLRWNTTLFARQWCKIVKARVHFNLSLDFHLFCWKMSDRELFGRKSSL